MAAAQQTASARHPTYLWDYDIDEQQFHALLDGSLTLGRLDRDWAAVRLIEYAPYGEIVRLLGFRALAAGWAGWRKRIRALSRRRGLDFLVAYLAEHRPDLV